jgi:BirA family biotin operon repressor/biotin-[acetyl-CoA-carboxylase] ligase
MMMNTKIIKLDEVNSTNSYLHDYVDGEQHDITIVTARHQTAGRGQGTNKWSSERGRESAVSAFSFIP